MNKWLLLWASFIILLTACTNNTKDKRSESEANPQSSIHIIDSLPHDTASFTEGLLVYNGDFYESIGEYGASKLLQTDRKTGKPLRAAPLDDKYFGEGLAIINDTAYQLTWREHTVFVYDVRTFRKINEFHNLTHEGWGLTTDGKLLMASGGSSNIYFYNPTDFRLLKTVTVTEEGNPVGNINELEYIDGYLYANQFQMNYIYKIDPANGQVVAKYDLSNLVARVQASQPNANVLNGIAYDAAIKKIFITGKKWACCYEVTFH